VESKIDRLAYADCAHVEGELRARERGEEFPPRTHAAATCPACGCCGSVASPAPAAPLTAGELDALHFRFWSADHKRFDHIGFAHAVVAAYARDARRRRDD